ncbi:nuclear inhibitor of protein phosphatase 1-like [Varroa jacobsoni]|uniref:Nuclear inhibitor of protein phosphatase 1 n=1 Tax=Varroa destructor TaxID=109461 RepID=A0A7M7KN14_VARDE|nr:nuclear inhibitor of protein phosphatase 1-like [Varroa destructor]XP_022669341.1 nuclear inhibitor of protein phosphatase 1-like [Varroa destructor]XP_022669342.1 nuclear inhibitor of protein phosphatase 1-like [Varroa destructor]XP_022698452.1 nuclear inhibitor of protein phosphatase 1-like [Varroa jacobsoni]XP_022698453.1 nuclear inhibitor of protein phosphatase 1-like [Varroa jacobsoni]
MSSHYDPPSWAGKPPLGLHLDVTKEDKFLQKLMIDQKKCYLFGRNADICDFPVEHQSCSRVHAALVYHRHLERAFLVDLGSTHGTFIGSIRLESQKPTQLPVDAKFHFGASTRIYVLRERPQNKEEEGISVELPESELELDNLTEYNTAHNRRVTMLGITDDTSHKPRRASHRKRVNFRNEEDVINPEDIDPSVGRFRNLVHTQVIPTKRPRLVDDGSGGGAERAGGSDAVGSSVGSKEASSVGNQQRLQSSSLFALPLLSSKLGLQLPNPAPDIYADLEPPQEEAASNSQAGDGTSGGAIYPRPVVKAVKTGALLGTLQDFAGPSPLDAPQKKRYPKEAWSGKKSNSIGGLF